MSSLNEISTEQLRGEGGENLIHEPPPISTAEPVFVNVYGAQESIPRNRFRQLMQPGGRNDIQGCEAGNRFQGSLKGPQIRAQASGQIFKDDVIGFSFTSDICIMSLPEHDPFSACRGTVSLVFTVYFLLGKITSMIFIRLSSKMFSLPEKKTLGLK